MCSINIFDRINEFVVDLFDDVEHRNGMKHDAISKLKGTQLNCNHWNGTIK